MNFENFRQHIQDNGPSNYLEIDCEDKVKILYAPLQHLNADARLVLVGITPGPKQLATSYQLASELIDDGLSNEDCLREINRQCAFAGMRPRINRMIEHFSIHEAIEVSSAQSLWDDNFECLHTTSLIQHAAFVNDKKFNGPFAKILESKLLRSYLECFGASVSTLKGTAAYIAMGPVVLEGLQWCANAGYIDEAQIIGWFPHPSGESGSQFSYFIKDRKLEDLKPLDPVRSRVENLDAAYENLLSSLDRISNLRIRG